MKNLAALFVPAALWFTSYALPQPFILGSPYSTNMPAIRKAIGEKGTFSLPGLRSTSVHAERLISEDSSLLRLANVTLKTGEFYVEVEGLEYNWETHEAKLIGASRLLPLSTPSPAR